jgi:hypothetical protein
LADKCFQAKSLGWKKGASDEKEICSIYRESGGYIDVRQHKNE